jgi:hypothetical protein
MPEDDEWIPCVREVLFAEEDFAAGRDLSAAEPPESAGIVDRLMHGFALRLKSFPAERTYRNSGAALQPCL